MSTSVVGARPGDTSAMQQRAPHLRRLENESIHIIREVVAECRAPVMLYSIGKDSSVMLHLAMKAFYPAKPPFPLLHVEYRLEVPRDDHVPRRNRRSGSG